ncbi:MAG: hypothetical protein CMD78_01740 [Gammaproteobacteria bacterium]|nr:hypothetical protein [Gammaproteobacteria bacterium]
MSGNISKNGIRKRIFKAFRDLNNSSIGTSAFAIVLILLLLGTIFGVRNKPDVNINIIKELPTSSVSNTFPSFINNKRDNSSEEQAPLPQKELQVRLLKQGNKRITALENQIDELIPMFPTEPLESDSTEEKELQNRLLEQGNKRITALEQHKKELLEMEKLETIVTPLGDSKSNAEPNLEPFQQDFFETQEDIDQLESEVQSLTNSLEDKLSDTNETSSVEQEKLKSRLVDFNQRRINELEQHKTELTSVIPTEPIESGSPEQQKLQDTLMQKGEERKKALEEQISELNTILSGNMSNESLVLGSETFQQDYSQQLDEIDKLESVLNDLNKQLESELPSSSNQTTEIFRRNLSDQTVKTNQLESEIQDLNNRLENALPQSDEPSSKQFKEDYSGQQMKTKKLESEIEVLEDKIISKSYSSDSLSLNQDSRIEYLDLTKKINKVESDLERANNKIDQILLIINENNTNKIHSEPVILEADPMDVSSEKNKLEETLAEKNEQTGNSINGTNNLELELKSLSSEKNKLEETLAEKNEQTGNSINGTNNLELELKSLEDKEEQLKEKILEVLLEGNPENISSLDKSIIQQINQDKTRIKFTLPIYPEKAREPPGIEGSCVAAFVISVANKPKNLNLNCTNKIFITNTRKAINEWQYLPDNDEEKRGAIIRFNLESKK